MIKILSKTGKDVAEQVNKKLTKRLIKDATEDNQKKAKQLADNIDLDYLNEVAFLLPNNIADVAEDSGAYALAQVGIDVTDKLVDKVYDRAVKYAKNRSAEMVGKKWVNGKLVDNPNAKWVITDSTRDELQRIIFQGLEDNIGKSEIADLIESSAAFSPERAEMIANTEIGTANSQGALDGYKAAKDIGLNIKKIWIADENPCEECQANEDDGPIDLEDTFSSGDDSPLAHPGCECVLSAEVDEDMENQDNSEENNE